MVSSSGPPSPPPWWRRPLFWSIAGVLVAVIGVAVAILELGAAGRPTPPSVASAAPATAASCVARAIPDATRTEARALVAGVRLEEAAYRLEGLNVPDSEPQIEAAGRIDGVTVQAGEVLQLLSWGNPNSSDTMGNPGDGRYYHVGSFTADDSCWSFGPGRACYAGCEGLTLRYSFVTMPEESVRELELRLDGLSSNDLRRLGAEQIGEFSVPIVQ